jgi:hypothetical protein
LEQILGLAIIKIGEAQENLLKAALGRPPENAAIAE